jgi:iron complex transport system ATP-binding protein
VLPAGALAQEPDVLVLDEPTNHLDVRHPTELLALLRHRRRTTLLSLHDLNAAASVCDRLHVMHAGPVVASGPPREVLTPALLAEVFGVRAAVLEHPLTGGPLIAYDHRHPGPPLSRDGRGDPDTHRRPRAGTVLRRACSPGCPARCSPVEQKLKAYKMMNA